MITCCVEFTYRPKQNTLYLPVEVGPLNAASGSGERCKLPQRGLGRTAGIDFGAF